MTAAAEADQSIIASAGLGEAGGWSEADQSWASCAAARADHERTLLCKQY